MVAKTLQRSGAALEPIETASQDELRGLQESRFLSLVQYAYDCSPFYRARFDKIGLNPNDVRCLEDISLIPFTTKDDLRQHYPFGMFAVDRTKLRRIHASSGTTGQPTVVGYTKNDIETWANLVARSIRASGGQPSDMVHIAYGYGLFTGGLGAHYGAEKLGCTVVPVSGGMTDRQVQLICDFKPDIIMVTPSYMLAILDAFRAQGLEAGDCSLKVGIFGAEPWGEEMRTEIEKAFNIDAVNIYGLSEIMGPGVANECVETKDGLHIWEDHFYPEIINPEGGEILPDGDLGELVFTTLTKEALPLLRYRTRDLTRLLPGTARSMRRMERITGRSDDMIILRGVNVFPTQIEEQVIKCDGLSAHYQIELSQNGRMSSMCVHVETLADATADKESRQATAKKLQHEIKDSVGVTTQVIVHDTGGVPRSEGKAHRVIDNRK